MKKFLKLFLVAVASLGIFASCGEETKEPTNPTQAVEATVKSIAVDASSVPAEIKVGQAETEIAKIKLVVTMSDGSTKNVNVTKEMISAKDLEKLADIGTYKVTITYEGVTAEVTLVVVEDEEVVTLTSIELTVEETEIAVNYGASYSVLDGVKAIGNDGISYVSKLTYVITNAAGETVDKLNTQVENEVYTIVISIDYAGIKKSVTKTVTVGEKPDTSGNLLLNGSFVATDGKYAGWDEYIADGGVVTLETEMINDVAYAKVVENVCANTAYGIRLNNNKDNYFTLYTGQAYQVSFYAKASAAKTIQCQVGQLVGGAPYYYDFGGQPYEFTFTTEMQLYTFTFVASNVAGGDMSCASVTFEMGTVSGDSTAATIWLGEVAVTEFNGEVADTLAPVITASNKTVYIGEADVVDLNALVSVNDAVDGVVTPTYVIKDAEGNVVNSIDGTVAGEYTVDITAVDAAGNESNASIVVKVKARNTAAEVKYEVVDGAIPNAGEDALVEDTLSYWNDQNWCGSVVTMVKNESANGVATFEYTATGACTFGFQVFLKNSSLDEGSTYTLKLKVNVATAITATINGTPVELVVGDNDVAVQYVEGNGMSSIDIQFPITDGCSNTIKLSDIRWASDSSKITFDLVDGAIPNAGEDALVEDTLSYWNDQNWCGSVVTMVKNEQANGVATFEYTATGACTFGFQVFLKNSSLDEGTSYELKLNVNVATAITATINGEAVELAVGDNAVAVKYVEGNGMSSIDIQFPITDGCSNTIKLSGLTWEEAKQEEVEQPEFGVISEVIKGEGRIAPQNLGKIVYWTVDDLSWNCGPICTSTATLENNVLKMVNTQPADAMSWGVQFFYEVTDIKEDGTYTLSLNVKSSVAGKISFVINGVTEVVELVAGDNTVSFSAGALTAGKTYTLNVTFGYQVDDVQYPIGDGTFEFSGWALAK